MIVAPSSPKRSERRLEPLLGGLLEREVVDGDELAVVSEHRSDKARATIRADLDVALPRVEEPSREVQERQVVLAREAWHSLQHLLEPSIARSRRLRKSLEKAR